MRQCCYIDDKSKLPCEQKVEFEIVDLADNNLYQNYTESCINHVGNLLGHDTSLPAGIYDGWRIISI
jgi:hypothetical protein